MKSFELMKSDKVMEQSDSWFPARSADLLVACRLTHSHTVPNCHWYNSRTQCYGASAIAMAPKYHSITQCQSVTQCHSVTQCISAIVPQWHTVL